MKNCVYFEIQTQLTHFFIIFHHYICSFCLCRGNFGTVRRATHKETGIQYAAKFLRRRRRATCWIKQIQHEIAVLLLSRDSKQIVKLHAVYETRNEYILILEMWVFSLKVYNTYPITFDFQIENENFSRASGDLQAILDEEGSLTEQKTRCCIREVLMALNYLHMRNVAHLDIKPQNILLNSSSLDGKKFLLFPLHFTFEENFKLNLYVDNAHSCENNLF